MPRGIPNHKSPAPDMAPEPFIMITAVGDQLKLNAYEMDAPQVIHSLRLALLHLVASAGGIVETFSGSTTIVVAAPAPPSTNGTKPPPAKKPAPKKASPRRLPREIVEPDPADAEWAAIQDDTELSRSIAAQAGSYYDDEG